MPGVYHLLLFIRLDIFGHTGVRKYIFGAGAELNIAFGAALYKHRMRILLEVIKLLDIIECPDKFIIKIIRVLQHGLVNSPRITAVIIRPAIRLKDNPLCLYRIQKLIQDITQFLAQIIHFTEELRPFKHEEYALLER